MYTKHPSPINIRCILHPGGCSFFIRSVSRLPRSTENPENPALRPLKTQQNEQIPVAKYTIPPKSRTSHPDPSHIPPELSHEPPAPSRTLSSCFPTFPLHNNAHIKMLLRRQRDLADIFLVPEKLPKSPFSRREDNLGLLT